MSKRRWSFRHFTAKNKREGFFEKPDVNLFKSCCCGAICVWWNFLNGKFLGQFFCLYGAHKSTRAYSLRYLFFGNGEMQRRAAHSRPHTHSGLFCLKTTALSLVLCIQASLSLSLSLSLHHCCCCNNLFVVTGAIMWVCVWKGTILI